MSWNHTPPTPNNTTITTTTTTNNKKNQNTKWSDLRGKMKLNQLNNENLIESQLD